MASELAHISIGLRAAQVLTVKVGQDALKDLRKAGLRLIDERARRGIRNSRVAFIHPSATGGVLTEIVQPAEDH